LKYLLSDGVSRNYTRVYQQSIAIAMELDGNLFSIPFVLHEQHFSHSWANLQ
jgi:hypothetical protein